MSGTITIHVKGDLQDLRRAADGRGIKYCLAEPTRFDANGTKPIECMAKVAMTAENYHAVMSWFAEPPHVAPLPRGACLFYSVSQKEAA